MATDEAPCCGKVPASSGFMASRRSKAPKIKAASVSWKTKLWRMYDFSYLIPIMTKQCFISYTISQIKRPALVQAFCGCHTHTSLSFVLREYGCRFSQISQDFAFGLQESNAAIYSMRLSLVKSAQVVQVWANNVYRDFSSYSI